MSDVRAFYGRWAGVYDRLATLPVVRGWRARAADALDLSPGDTVVEMGCGTGANLPHLRERVGPDGRVVGVDFTRPLLAHARRRIERAGWNNVHLARADATRPPVREADAVLGTFVVGLLADPGAAVERWCDLLSAGGRIALVDATHSTHPVGRALNPAFRAFVALGAPSTGVRAVLAAPVRPDADAPLSRRVEASRESLARRTVERRSETFGLGFVGLLCGRVP